MDVEDVSSSKSSKTVTERSKLTKMKTILFVLALVAVALAAPADDNSGKKPEKIREKGNTEYDANLKFNWRGDGSWKSKLEGAFKPIADFLNTLGLKGELDSESDGKGGGDISGNFRLSGKRGNGAKSNDAADANTQSSGNTAEASSSNGPKSGRNGVASAIEAGQNALNGIPVPQGLPNLSGLRSGKNPLPQLGQKS